MLRLVELKTGIEKVKGLETLGLGRTKRLDPGKSLRSDLLLSEVPIETPGEYELSVRYEEAESIPIRLTLRRSIPKNPSFDTVQGIVTYGVFANWASDPPTLVRTELEVRPGGGVSDAVTLAPATLHSKPVISLPPNGSDRQSHWVAWLEGSALKFVHASDRLGVGPVGSFDLGSGEAELAAPIYSNPVTDTQVRPAGAAIVWVEGRFRVVPFSGQSGPRMDLPGPRPKWIAGLAKSKGDRFVLCAQSVGNRTTLLKIPWSDRTLGPASLLGEWEGSFLAAGATMDLEGVTHGALWLQGPASVEWTLGPDGFEARPPRSVPWNRPEIIRALVRVSAQGNAAALLCDAKGEWVLETGRIRSLPPAAATTKLPLDVVFLGGVEPILLLAESGTGFRLMRMDGEPLPPRPF